jgi:hypothetical protein
MEIFKKRRESKERAEEQRAFEEVRKVSLRDKVLGLGPLKRNTQLDVFMAPLGRSYKEQAADNRRKISLVIADPERSVVQVVHDSYQLGVHYKEAFESGSRFTVEGISQGKPVVFRDPKTQDEWATKDLIVHQTEVRGQKMFPERLPEQT